MQERFEQVRNAVIISISACALSACSQSEPADPVEENTPAPSITATESPPPETAPEEDNEDGFAPAREAIDDFCDGEAACIRTQREELAYFVNMMAAFDDRNGVVAERCMRSGLVDGGVDWTIATPCMRHEVEGKPIGAPID